MTNFESIKDKIWKAAQKQNKKKFDKECDNLMKKVVNDWWRVGWMICPKTPEELIKLLNKTAKLAHKSWIKAMKCGDAPPEDISPGEGFAWCAKIVKELYQKQKRAKQQ